MTVYLVIQLAHLAIGLPATGHLGWSLPYLALGFLLWVISIRRRRLLIPLAFVYLLAPLGGTLLIGYMTATNTYSASPPARERVQSVYDAPAHPLIIHISDSHVLASGATRTWEGKPRDPAVLARLMSQILRLRPRYLLITGDVTDSGKDAEWRTASALLLDVAQRAGISVILAPGNHDLQPAFRGVSNAGSPERAGAVLARRYLDRQMAMNPALISVEHGSLTSLLNWQPSEREVASTAAQVYKECLNTMSLMDDQARAVAMGCELASKPEVIREILITFRTESARLDWFPLVYEDKPARTYTIVLCSVGMRTASLGDNAVGSFGVGQLRRLGVALDRIPSDVRHVFILVHHPVVRRWGEKLTLPRHWWRYADWVDSPLYNAALLDTGWSDSRRVIDMTRDAIERRPSATFTLFYGHEHKRSLSVVGFYPAVLLLSEAPAFGEGNEPGFRAFYEGTSGAQLEPVWLRM